MAARGADSSRCGAGLWPALTFHRQAGGLHYTDHRVPERLELRIADSINPAQLVQRCRPRAGKLAQGLVAEDDVRRHAPLLRFAATPDAQRLEELAIVRCAFV